MDLQEQTQDLTAQADLDTSAEITTETESGGLTQLEGQGNALPKDSDGQQALADKPDGEAPKPDFVPNLEYTAGGQVKKFDEKIAALIKDKETEEVLRTLHAKADGIEFLQNQREAIRNEYKSLQNEVNQVLAMAEKKDLGGVLRSVGHDPSDISGTLQALGYKKRDIIEHAYSLASLTPEQEQYQNQLRQEQAQREQLEKQNQSYQSQLEQVQVQTRANELQMALSKPDIAPLVQNYDKTFGPNAFYTEVANRGALHWHTRKVDVPTEQLVQEVLMFAKNLAPQQTAAPTQTTPNRSGPPPVIPVLGGGGGKAPVSKKITSIAGMKAYAESLSD